LKKGFATYLPFGGLIALVLLAEFIIIGGSWVEAKDAGSVIASPTPPMDVVSNAEAIGRILYTDYIFFFQAAGIVLMIAMVGAITLTLRHRPGVRRQVVADQTARNRETGVAMTDPKPGEGVSL
jgi:NADH-quinone oxidoreductase subunit J